MSNLPLVDLNQILRRIQSKPGYLWIFIGIFGAGLLLMAQDRGNENRSCRVAGLATEVPSAKAPAALENNAASLEKELETILGRMAGVGRVRVEIRLKSDSRKIWERKTQVTKHLSQQSGEMNSEESDNNELVFVKDRDGDETPVLKEELAPEIQGVLVVAWGARDCKIKQLLTETVMTVLELPAHRVLVMAGEDGMQ